MFSHSNSEFSTHFLYTQCLPHSHTCSQGNQGHTILTRPVMKDHTVSPVLQSAQCAIAYQPWPPAFVIRWPWPSCYWSWRRTWLCEQGDRDSENLEAGDPLLTTEVQEPQGLGLNSGPVFVSCSNCWLTVLWPWAAGIRSSVHSVGPYGLAKPHYYFLLAMEFGQAEHFHFLADAWGIIQIEIISSA